MDRIEPFGFFLLMVAAVMWANIMMVLTNRAVARYRRSGSVFWLYTAGMAIALCALVMLSPGFTIQPPNQKPDAPTISDADFLKQHGLE